MPPLAQLLRNPKVAAACALEIVRLLRMRSAGPRGGGWQCRLSWHNLTKPDGALLRIHKSTDVEDC
jgi:hypothetical protein